MDNLGTISQNKRACTGVGLVYDSAPRLNPAATSADGFTNLVSQYYMFFREAIAQDVSFLRGVEGHRAIAEFDRAIYLLRTAKQHDDNPEATQFFEHWIEEHPTWQQAVDALAELLERALEQLARISGRVRRDAALARAWNERASAEPTSIFESVCADLAVTFNDRLAAILIRNVERRAKRLRPGEDARAAVEALCAEEITNQAKRLPVPYHAVLDRLGLIGRSRAQAALLLAYSISASTTLGGEAFLLRVEEAWKVATH
jgi:hypothetical protein